MLNLKEWMELVDYRITEGGDYGWRCFGPNAHMLDSWNGEHDGHSFTVIFDTKTQTVYEVQAHDYVHNRAYRMINPAFKQAFDSESHVRGEIGNQAWDDVDYIDLEVDDDFFQKALAIKDGDNYDTRISVPVDFSDEELLKYARMAHEQDITLNQFIENALRAAIDEYDRDPEGSKSRAAQWKAEHDQEATAS
jgi:hypothetical protein